MSDSCFTDRPRAAHSPRALFSPFKLPPSPWPDISGRPDRLDLFLHVQFNLFLSLNSPHSVDLSSFLLALFQFSLLGRSSSILFLFGRFLLYLYIPSVNPSLSLQCIFTSSLLLFHLFIPSFSADHIWHGAAVNESGIIEKMFMVKVKS